MIAYNGLRYDEWLRAIIVGVPLLILVLGGISSAQGEALEAVILFASTAFVLGVFWAVLPRRLEVWTDRIRIVMGWPFRFNVPSDTVSEIRSARARDALVYSGLRFSPSVRTPVEVRRTRGINVVVSPHDRQQFLETRNGPWTATAQARRPRRADNKQGAAYHAACPHTGLRPPLSLRKRGRG